MEPHIVHVTAQNRLTATVEAAVEKAVKRVLDARLVAATSGAVGGKDWLTSKEAQSYLQLSKATLARYRAEGTLPFSRLGANVYYRRADVEAVLAAGAVRVGRGAAGDGAAVPAVAPVLLP